MKAEQQRQQLEQQRETALANETRYLDEARDLRGKLAEIRTRLDSPQQLQARIKGDAGAIRANDELSRKAERLERDIADREKFAASFRQEAETLAPQIETWKIVEGCQKTIDLAATARQVAGESKAVIAGLLPIVSRLRTGIGDLRDNLQTLPVRERRQIATFVDELAKFPGHLLLAELGKVFAENNTPLPLPETMMQQDVCTHLDNLAAAMKTLSATHSGESGRIRYVARVRASGGRNHLALEPGDVVALDPRDEITKRLLGLGVIEEAA